MATRKTARSKPTLVARYGVIGIALFGSTVRDTARADSDIDILVSFEGPALMPSRVMRDGSPAFVEGRDRLVAGAGEAGLP